MGADIIGKPSIRKSSSTKTGTAISFKLMDDLFEDTALPKELLNNRAIEVAFNNPGVTVEYKHKTKKEKYKYKKGLEDIVKKISKNYYKFEADNMEFFVITDVHKGPEELMFTWVNSSLLFNGGLCNTQFLNAFYDNVLATLEPKAKKIKCKIAKNDVRQNVLVLGTMKVADPQYDSQSKTRLTGPNKRNEIQAMFKKQWTAFTKKQKGWLEDVFKAATEKGDAKAARTAAKEMEKLSASKIPGLLDATGKNRADCKILITEGLSASRMIGEVRDSKTIASYPLTGKVNNVWGAKPAAVMQMGKLTGFFAAVGLHPGRPIIRSQLRYGGIVIATDADYDGDDIFTLLCNALYQFWPDCFDPNQEPLVYRLVAPNVVASKGKQRIHFPTLDDFRKVEKKYSSWNIEYMKGLGSMSKVDWDMILNGVRS
jgi:DNA gyrase subunit B